MIHCLVKGRFTSTYGNSVGGIYIGESNKSGLKRTHFIQATTQSREFLTQFLEDVFIKNLRRHLSPLLLNGIPVESWSPGRLGSEATDLEKEECVRNVSQRLDELVCISGKDESPREAEITTSSPQGETGSVSQRDLVSFGAIRGRKAAKPWRGRLKSRSASHLKLFGGLNYGPTVFSILTLYDKHGSSPQRCSLYGSREDAAWIDLDGRLVNADTATSLKEIGGQLGELESCVWEGLCPLQRVLVIAVAAVAASASKEKTATEVFRLRQVIYERECALVLMREELGNLKSRVDIRRSQLKPEKEETCPSDSLDDLSDLLSQVDLQQLCQSELEEPNCFSGYGNEVRNPSRNRSDEQVSEMDSEIFISPAVNRQLTFSDLSKKISPIHEESPTTSGGSGQELMEKMTMSNSWLEALDMALLLEEEAPEREFQSAEGLVNKDVVFEQSVCERDPEKEITELEKEDLRSSYRIFESNLQADTIQDNANAAEWLSETSSVIMDPFSPMPSEKYGNNLQETEGCSKEWWQKTVAEEKSFADRARCANIILDVKKQVIGLLDDAASNVLEALTFIGDQARQLEGPETNALTPRKPQEAWNKKCQAAAIKDNVSKASTRIAILQTTMVHLWDSVGPEAMASLDISPSDFDDYLANLQIAKILNDDACELSTGSVSIQTWQDWFRRGFDNPESSFLRRIQVSGQAESETESEAKIFDNLQPLSEWPPSGSIHTERRLKKELSPGIAAVRQKVEKIMLPLFDNMPGTESVQKNANLVTVAEELVAEFERSAAKAASLKTYVKACDRKRKQVERKLLEAWEQDSKNQVKSSNEITELKRQVRLKEAAYQQLISSRKALVSSKNKEIAELREDSRRQNTALQDMASAAKATQESSEKRLAMLEEICRKKDSSIMGLKQEIFELEGRVQELQACQTPAQLRPMNLPPAERETDSESTEDVFENEASYRMFGDDCQLRNSYQSLCGSENRRTSWGSDLSAQEFHIIDTPWSSELNGGQDFNIIEEAAFQGRSLSIFQNVASSQEFLRSSLRRLGTTPGGGIDLASSGSSSSSSSKDPESRPTVNIHKEARKDNRVPNFRKELSKSVTNMNMVTVRCKKRDDRLRASTGVLSAVGLNTPFKPRRSTSLNKEMSESSLPNSFSSSGNKPKENASKGRQKWV